MPALAPGTRLGSYDIVALLGAGGMGEVYRARDPRLGREVALKVLPAAVAADVDRLARFEREARAVAALNHPGIVTIHSIEQDGEVRFLTMELVDGQTLDRMLGAGGLPLGRVLELAIPLADALAAAHARGVIHRDLKPGNVMVTRDGRLKVLDFGLAKLEEGAATTDTSSMAPTQVQTMESPVSAAGQVVGTAPYMAPEQLRGGTVDARADLFSFGIMLYELLTGVRPFTGASWAELSSSILRDAPASLGDRRADMPRDLERLVTRCLEKDPERRIQTAKDVRNELELVRRESGDAGAKAPATDRRRAPASVTAAADAPSVAVLPFANRSRDEDDEYFSDGLADELLNVLARIRGLRVAARTSSATFKGKDVTIADVGRALNVATVLEGSVRKSGNRVRIAVQLVKVADGYPLWSETYDRTLDDIFAVQDDIAQSVVKELRTALLGEAPDSKASGEVRAEVQQAGLGRVEDAEAHRLYLLGRHLVQRLNREDVERGVGYLREALEREPRFALAWVALSEGLRHQSDFGWSAVSEGYGHARDAARRALEIEPGLAEAYAALAQVQVSADWDWKGAEASYVRALELAPGNSDVLAGAALLELQLGHFELARQHAEQASALDPLNATAAVMHGRALRLLGRHEEALTRFRKSIEVGPTRILTHFWTAIGLDDVGRPGEAIAEAEREHSPWARYTVLGVLHARHGRLDESAVWLERLEREFGDIGMFQMAAVHAARGEADAMFAWLERGVRDRDPGTSAIAFEPIFDPYRSDPRWPAMLRAVGFRD